MSPIKQAFPNDPYNTHHSPFIIYPTFLRNFYDRLTHYIMVSAILFYSSYYNVSSLSVSFTAVSLVLEQWLQQR
jgi:hypothetical protein